MRELSLVFLGAFLLSGSAWLIQKPFIRPVSKTRRDYGLGTSEAPRISNDLVVPGIQIPLDPFIVEAISLLSTNVTQNLLLDQFAGISFFAGNFVNVPKSNLNALDNLQGVYLKNAITNKADLPPNYKYFGNGNVEEILKQLLLTNPFFTSALEYKAGGLAISSYAKNEDPTRYSKLITAYDARFPRVNVKLNRNNLEVTEYKVYDASGNDITSKYKRDEALKLFLFTLIYYAEVVHSSIHIFDYISVLGLFSSTSGSSPAVFDWAGSYLSNVPKKYFEVATLLYNEQDGALASPAGFNANRTQVLQFITDEVLKSWLHYKTANQFVDEFAFAYIPKRQRDGFLKAFLDQVNLIPDFTNELSAAIDQSSNGQSGKINEKLEKYYHDIGNDISNIKDIGAWIQLMSVLNIVHGSTFSFSRFIATAHYLPYLDFTNTGNYTEGDVKNAITVLGTTFGLASDRYVFSSKLVTPSRAPDKIILPVLQKYDAASNDLKIKYFNTIKKDPKFAEYGWIWTDFGPDLIDNKQLTIATYV